MMIRLCLISLGEKAWQVTFSRHLFNICMRPWIILSMSLMKLMKRWAVRFGRSQGNNLVPRFGHCSN